MSLNIVYRCTMKIIDRIMSKLGYVRNDSVLTKDDVEVIMQGAVTFYILEKENAEKQLLNNQTTDKHKNISYDA